MAKKIKFQKDDLVKYTGDTPICCGGKRIPTVSPGDQLKVTSTSYDKHGNEMLWFRLQNGHTFGASIADKYTLIHREDAEPDYTLREKVALVICGACITVAAVFVLAIFVLWLLFGIDMREIFSFLY